MAGEAKSLKVFVSYSRADVSFADQLVLALEDKGFEAILDRHDISGAENWRERLGKLILSADAVAFVLTAKSAASEICAWEVDEAVRLGKRIIPITHESVDGVTPPKALSELNWIPFYADPAIPGSGFYYGVKRLVEALSVDLDWLRAQTRNSERAIEWSKLRAEDLLLRGEALKEAEAWLARTPAGSHPPDLVREYLAASGDAEQHRQVAAKAQLEEREQALKTAEIAVADNKRTQERLRRFSLWALVAGVLLLAIAIPGNYFAATRTLDANDRKAALFADAANGLSRQGDYTRALLIALAGDPPARVGLLEELMRPNGNVAVRNALARAYASDRAVTSMDVEDATSVAVLADGRRFLTVHASGAMMLWTAGDTLDPKPIAMPKKVARIFPMPDGDTLVLGWQASPGQPFGVWSLKENRLLREFGPTLTTETMQWPQVAALSYEGDWLVTGDSGKVTVWDPNTGAEIKSATFDTIGFDVVAASSKYDTVVLAASERVLVWRPLGDKRIGPMEGGFGTVQSLAYLMDDTVIFGSERGNIGSVEADAKLSSALQTFSENLSDPDGVAQIRPSKDNRGMLLVSDRGQVRLLDLASQNVTEPFGRRSDIIDAGFLPDAGMLVAVSREGVVMLAAFGRSAQKDTLQSVFDMPAGSEPANGFTTLVARDGTLALVESDSVVRAWRPEMQGPVRFTLPPETIRAMPDLGFLFSSKASLLATSDGEKIHVWSSDAVAPRTTLALGKPSDGITDGQFVADGTALYYHLASGLAGVRRIDTTEDLFAPRTFTSTQLFPSPDGRRVAEAAPGGAIRIYESGVEKPVEFATRSTIRSGVFSPDGKIFALVVADDKLLSPSGRFELWHPGESRAFQLGTAHNGLILSLVFQPGGDLFVTTGDDLRVVLWRLGERDPVQMFELPLDAAGDGVPQFSADGKHLVTPTPVGVLRFEINPIVHADADTQVKLACERLAARGVAGFSNQDYAEYGFMQKVPPNPCKTLGVTLGVAKKP